MLFAFLASAAALAGNWVTPGNTFHVKDVHGPTTLVGGDHHTQQVYVCPVVTAVDADGDAINGCLASDVGSRVSPTDSHYTCRNVADTIMGKPAIVTYVDFDSGVVAGGRTAWNPVFPTSVDCTIQVGANPAHIHTMRFPIGLAAVELPRIASVDTVAKTWTQLTSTGITIQLPDSTYQTGQVKEVYINIPNGTFTGASAIAAGAPQTDASGANLSTTAGGTTLKDGFICGIRNSADEYLMVSMKRGTATSGTAYCKADDGTTRHIKLTFIP